MSVTVSPDKTMVVQSGSIDGRIQLWNIKNGKIIGNPWEGDNGHVICVDWSPNGQRIAS